MTDDDDQPKRAWNTTVYIGSVAVSKRLRSCGLLVSKVEMYRGDRGNIWEATTNDGRRWVSWTEGGGWKISKAPPGRKRE